VFDPLIFRKKNKPIHNGEPRGTAKAGSASTAVYIYRLYRDSSDFPGKAELKAAIYFDRPKLHFLQPWIILGKITVRVRSDLDCAIL